jgi:hypothetical protein
MNFYGKIRNLVIAEVKIEKCAGCRDKINSPGW